LTALGVEHLDGLGSLENVIAEEATLLGATPIRLVSTQARPYLNHQDLHTYGIEEGDFRGTDLEMRLDSSQFRYAGQTVVVPYPGPGPALGAIAALASAELLGLELDGVIERLARLTLPPGRMERLEQGGIIFINDAYNSSPVAAQAALKFLKEQSGTKWIVLGEMLELGSESLRHHLELARWASEVDGHLIFVGRFAQAMVAEAGGQAVQDVDQARRVLQERVKPGELVYLKASRGIRFERIVQEWGQA